MGITSRDELRLSEVTSKGHFR